ncbi:MULTISPECIES: J domain-containing protein [unclassified Bartonella]|uniref:J domain-containing protein n=1 Tax=unclassified Bartonella TaxID=2645622 RepID=UPI0035CE91BF
MILNEDDYYGILGVSYECNDKQIKSAFRKLALQYHPDHNSSTEAKQKFRKILEAYEVLKDPRKRAAYNQFYHKTSENTHKTSENNYKTSENTHKTSENTHKTSERGRSQKNRIKDNINNIKRVIFIICGITPLIYGTISLFTWNIPLGIISIGLLILVSIKGYLVKIGKLIFWLILIQQFLLFTRLILKIIS